MNILQSSISTPEDHETSARTIYLIRHGQTDYNKRGIVQGSGVDTDLNDTGLQQAAGFYNHYRHITFGRIFVSNLKRTHQTVAPFAQSNIPMEIIPELNEINWGIMEGVEPTPEIHNQFVSTLSRWTAGDLDFAVEGGETPNQLYARQQLGLEKIHQRADNPILICMHGRAMRSFLCLLTGTPLQQMDSFEHGNVCLYVLERSPGSPHYEIVLRNSRLHLHDALH